MIKKIKILSHDVDVIQVAASEFNSEALHHGMFSTGRNAILLNKDLCESRAWSTLWHEVVEWIASDLEIDMDHSQISALSEVLAQVIHDNFDLSPVSLSIEEMEDAMRNSQIEPIEPFIDDWDMEQDYEG